MVAAAGNRRSSWTTAVASPRRNGQNGNISNSSNSGRNSTAVFGSGTKHSLGIADANASTRDAQLPPSPRPSLSTVHPPAAAGRSSPRMTRDGKHRNGGAPEDLPIERQPHAHQDTVTPADSPRPFFLQLDSSPEKEFISGPPMLSSAEQRAPMRLSRPFSSSIDTDDDDDDDDDQDYADAQRENHSLLLCNHAIPPHGDADHDARMPEFDSTSTAVHTEADEETVTAAEVEDTESSSESEDEDLRLDRQHRREANRHLSQFEICYNQLVQQVLYERDRELIALQESILAGNNDEYQQSCQELQHDRDQQLCIAERRKVLEIAAAKEQLDADLHQIQRDVVMKKGVLRKLLVSQLERVRLAVEQEETLERNQRARIVKSHPFVSPPQPADTTIVRRRPYESRFARTQPLCTDMHWQSSSSPLLELATLAEDSSTRNLSITFPPHPLATPSMLLPPPPSPQLPPSPPPLLQRQQKQRRENLHVLFHSAHVVDEYGAHVPPRLVPFGLHDQEIDQDMELLRGCIHMQEGIKRRNQQLLDEENRRIEKQEWEALKRQKRETASSPPCFPFSSQQCYHPHPHVSISTVHPIVGPTAPAT